MVSPLRGEWIEISKNVSWAIDKPPSRLSEASGLKLVRLHGIRAVFDVSPLRGEWIEIPSGQGWATRADVSPLRGEWIEIIWACGVLD